MSPKSSQGQPGEWPGEFKRRKTSNFIHSDRRNVTEATRIRQAHDRVPRDGPSSPPYNQLKLVLPSKTPASASVTTSRIAAAAKRMIRQDASGLTDQMMRKRRIRSPASRPRK
jgi:hypothetical protein